MDNDKAIADAIAALEPFANMLCLIDDKDPSKGYAFDRWRTDHVLFDIGSDRKITVGDLRLARLTLASLRAVAPAPADQSDIPLWAHWSSASAMTASNIDKQFTIVETRRAELAAELKFRGRPPADQSDAGREEIALKDLALFWQGRANALAILDNKRAVSDDMTHEAIKIYMECADELRRALDSAPSETVGRETACLSAIASNEPCQTDGENLRRCQICGFIVDTQFEAEKPAIDFTMAGRSRSLSTADRDAIREALKREERYLIRQCRSEADIMPGDIQGAFHRIRTAALGLLGEG